MQDMLQEGLLPEGPAEQGPPTAAWEVPGAAQGPPADTAGEDPQVGALPAEGAPPPEADGPLPQADAPPPTEEPGWVEAGADAQLEQAVSGALLLERELLAIRADNPDIGSYATVSADGQPLFSTAHGSITEGCDDQSNLFKVAFSLESLDRVQEKMQDFRDDDGNLLNVSPDTIVIPNAAPLKRAVLEAIGSELDPRSPNHAYNFQMGLWRVLVWNYLPKTLAGKPYFMLLDSKFNSDYMCLPWLDRLPLTVRSDIEPETDANVWRGRARFGAGFNNWRAIALCGEGFSGTLLD
ncbi:MAG: hypothetical protein GXX99_01575 [Clostridiales bacterium]|nr:hypothetical protein [Clostridiales bacterium]